MSSWAGVGGGGVSGQGAQGWLVGPYLTNPANHRTACHMNSLSHAQK